MVLSRVIQNPDEYRRNIREKLGLYFKLEKDAINLEKGIHNWTIKEANNRKVVRKWDNHFFVMLYNSRLKTIMSNLKNPKLIELVEANEIKSQDIAFMTHQEMDPEKWHDMIEAKKIRDKNKSEQTLEAMTDRYTCRKCRSKKCSYYQMQIRSSDEPATTYVTCLDCGARMKFN